MSDLPFKPDEIGVWSEIKLEIVSKYGEAYTNAFNRLGSRLRKYYVDGFSGAGIHVSRRTGAPVEGSPSRALRITPPFDSFYFIDMDADKTAYLEGLRNGRPDVTVHTGDANPYLRRLLPTIRYEEYKRALCLLDPYGLHLDWEVMRLAGQAGTVDLFLNFPIMDINRNALWRDPERVPAEGIERMNRFWGDGSWRTVGYAAAPQGSLFGPTVEKQSNDAIVAAFRKRLREVAGFGHVADPLPMRNSTNAVVYYLFFASAKPVAQKIIADIFKKYR